MRVLKRNPWLSGLGVLLAVVTITGYARADVTTDEPGSIVIFPKVIADGSHDTLIQLTNTSNSRVYVECDYVDTSEAAQGVCSGAPGVSCGSDAECLAQGDGTCIRCAVQNNLIQLTPQQPTHWFVSTGRSDDNPDNESPGFFFGDIAKHPVFLGEIKCFQLDSAGGVPVGGNALKGEALINNPGGQLSEYNGIAIQAVNGPSMPVCVGGGNDTFPCQSDSDCSPTSTTPGTCSNNICSGGANDGHACNGDPQCQPANTTAGTCKISLALDNNQYNACPAQLFVNHYYDGAESPSTGATVTSELTLVPCSENLETALLPTTTTVAVNDYNEMEELVGSKVLPFTCWLNISLGSLGLDASTIGSTFGKARLATSSGNQLTCVGGANAGDLCNGPSDCPNGACTGPPASGILGVLEEFHALDGAASGTAAINLHTTNSTRTLDTITKGP